MTPTGFEADTALAILAGGLVLLLAAALLTALRSWVTTARLRRHAETAALICDRCGGPLDRNGVCVFEYLASRGDDTHRP
jgi:hypothetical protein